MTGPRIRRENIPQASTRTLAPFSRSAVRIVSAAVSLAVGATLLAADEPGKAAQSGPDPAEIVDLQRQVNNLRSDLLDERERHIGRLQEANGAVLVVLGLLIGVGGLWAYAKFRSIASEARIGAAAARALATVEPNLIPQLGALSAESGVPPHPVSRLLRASAEAEAGPLPGLGGANGSPADTPASNGHRTGPERVDEPASGSALRLRQDRTTPDLDLGADDVDLQRYEDVAADCTEAIRLAPDDARLYLERGNALSGLQSYEAAAADYDRAILLDPDCVAAYLGRCRVRSELGLHDEALEDYERLASLDPDAAGSAGQA